jgi:hypothetical protein
MVPKVGSDVLNKPTEIRPTLWFGRSVGRSEENDTRQYPAGLKPGDTSTHELILLLIWLIYPVGPTQWYRVLIPRLEFFVVHEYICYL